MPLLLYSLSFVLLLALSWLAFSFAANDISLIYQPLLSFLQPIKLGADSEFISSSSDLLSVENLQVSSAVLFFEELLSFVLIIVLGALFYKVLDTRQWFIFKKEPSFNFSVSKIIGFFQKIFNFFKKKKKASNFFIPRSIFALNFNQITFWGLFIAGIAAFLLPQDSTCLLDLFGRLQFSLGSLWLDLLLSKLILWLSFAFLLSLLCKVLCDDEITELFFEEKFPELAEELAFKKVIYALVALNPLLITEVLWNGHIEILLAFSFLALVYYAFKKNYLSFLVLGLGPALLYYLLRGFSLERIMTPHNSFYDLMNSINNYIGGEDLPYGFRYFFLSLFLVFVLWVLYRFFLNKDSESLFYYSFLLALVFLLIALPGFYSWYFVILIPLGALLHPRLIFLLSLTHLLSYTFLDDLSLVNYLLMTVIPSVFYFRYLLRQDV